MPRRSLIPLGRLAILVKIATREKWTVRQNVPSSEKYDVAYSATLSMHDRISSNWRKITADESNTVHVDPGNMAGFNLLLNRTRGPASSASSTAQNFLRKTSN